MDKLIYTALSGMRASMDRQRILASNMANADTIGFRAELANHRPVTISGDRVEIRAMQQALVEGADMSGAERTRTGQPLDIALNGDALIAVQAPDGTEGYTRRGDLSVAASGLLINGAGHPVIGEGGPVTVPPGGAVSISPDGMVSVGDPAAPDQPPAPLTRIKLVSPAGSDIVKGVDGLFRVTDRGQLPEDLEASVATGHLEQSNVKMTEIMVEMIDQQRLFAMRSQLVSTAQELDESGAQLLRMGSR